MRRWMWAALALSAIVLCHPAEATAGRFFLSIGTGPRFYGPPVPPPPPRLPYRPHYHRHHHHLPPPPCAWHHGPYALHAHPYYGPGYWSPVW